MFTLRSTRKIIKLVVVWLKLLENFLRFFVFCYVKFEVVYYVSGVGFDGRTFEREFIIKIALKVVLNLFG